MATGKKSKKASRTKRKREQGPKLSVAENNEAAMELGVLVDMRLLKAFPYKRRMEGKLRKTNEYFLGTVINFQPAIEGHPPKKRHKINRPPLGPGLYRVLFDDGDLEDMDPDEALQCIITYQQQRRQRSDHNTEYGNGSPLPESKLIVGRTPGKTKRKVEVNDILGLESIMSYANPPLKEKELAILDKERTDYWLAYESYNLQQKIPRPNKLNVNIISSLWVPLNITITNATTITDTPALTHDSQPTGFQGNMTDLTEKSSTVLVAGDNLLNTKIDSSNSKSLICHDELDKDPSQAVDRQKASDEENAKKIWTTSKKKKTVQSKVSSTLPDEIQHENEISKDVTQKRINTLAPVQPDTSAPNFSTEREQKKEKESKSVLPKSIQPKGSETKISQTNNISRSKPLKENAKIAVSSKMNGKEEQQRKLSTRNDTKDDSKVLKQKSVKVVQPLQQPNLERKEKGASEKKQNNNSTTPSIRDVTSEEKAENDAFEAMSSKETVKATAKSSDDTILDESGNAVKEGDPNTDKTMTTNEGKKEETGSMSILSTEAGMLIAHESSKSNLTNKSNKQEGKGTGQIVEGVAALQKSPCIEDMGAKDEGNVTKQREQVQRLPHLMRESISIQQEKVIPATRQLKLVSIGHPRSDVIEGKKLYSRRELFAFGAHRSDHLPLNGNIVDGSDSILLHKPSEFALRRKDDLAMFKFARSKENGSEHLYINFKKNLPIRVFRRCQKSSPVRYRYDGLYSIIAVLDDEGCPRIEMPTSDFVRLEFLLKRHAASETNMVTSHENLLSVDQLWEEVNKAEEEITRQEKANSANFEAMLNAEDGVVDMGNNPKANVGAPNQGRRQKSADETEEQ